MCSKPPFDTGRYILKRTSYVDGIVGFQASRAFYKAADEAMMKAPNLDEHKAMISSIFKMLEKEHPVARP